MFGDITPNTISIFEDLINLDLVRGVDSTGIAFINEDYKVSVVKDTVLPYELMRKPDYIRNIKDNLIGLIGHNRAATKGGRKAANAHPFEVGDIVLAHNGTLRNQWRLPDDKDFENDSHNITHAINKQGIELTWRQTDGAAALVWWDKSSKSLNIISNMERPFHYAFLRNGNTLIWTSDDEILRRCLAMSGVTPWKNEVYKLTSDTLYSIRVGKKGRLVVSERKLQKFEHHFPAKGDFQGELGGGWKGPVGSRVHGGTGTFPGISGAANRAGHDNGTGHGGNVPRIGTPLTQLQKKLTEREFNEKYKKCTFCDDTLENKFECAVIIDSKVAVCGDCVATATEAGMRVTA